MTALTHRLRGHRLRKEVRHVDTSRRSPGGGVYIEAERIDHLLVCSCGERWIHVPEPFSNKWKWR